MINLIIRMIERDTPLAHVASAHPTIAAAFASALLELAVTKGARRDELLRRSGLDVATLSDRDARIPIEQWLELMRAGKEATGDAALALHFGETFDIGDLSVLGLMGRAVETKLEGFELLNRFSRLVCDVETADSERFKLLDDATGTWLVDTRLNPADTPEVSECGFAQIASMAQRLLPGTMHFQEVHFTHSAPKYLGEYHRIFGAPVVFDSDRNAMLMPVGWHGERIALQPRLAIHILRPHAELLLHRLDCNASMRRRVEESILRLLSAPRTTSAIAAQLGLTTQTLSRKLRAEGVTFGQVVEDVHRRLATHHLREGKLSVKETAYRLGYADPASFSRAFKRWTGVSPSRIASLGKRH